MRVLYYLVTILVASLCTLQAESVDVCFITIHPASAHHFARFTQELDQQQISWKILAADSAEGILKQKKISHSKISVWTSKKGIKSLSLQEQTAIAKLTAKACKKAKIVITDISEPFIACVHHELGLVSSAKRYVYYDNTEAYVPGEYSKCFSALLSTRPDGIIFANHRLSEGPVFGEDHRLVEWDHLDRVGIGFYPLEDINTLRTLTQNKETLRDKLFRELGIRDQQQKILLYLGGANTPYFEQGFPFFLRALDEHKTDPFFDNILFLLQQHPRAREECVDLYALLAKAFPFQVFTSPLPPLEALACSDLTYYYQTSMVPHILLGGRPLVQVAPVPFEDVGVRLQLVDAVSDFENLPKASVKAISNVHHDSSLKALEHAIGYDDCWPQNLTSFLQNHL